MCGSATTNRPPRRRRRAPRPRAGRVSFRLVRCEPAQQRLDMRLGDCARIEVEVGVATQRMLPQRQQKEWPGEQRQRGVYVHLAELTALYAADEDALDQAERPAQHSIRS